MHALVSLTASYLHHPAGVASGALNLINGLLGGLLPANLTGAGAPFTVTIIKDNGLGPTPVVFPQPAFSNIAGVTITASGSGSAPSLLGLSLDQVCFSAPLQSLTWPPSGAWACALMQKTAVMWSLPCIIAVHDIIGYTFIACFRG